MNLLTRASRCCGIGFVLLVIASSEITPAAQGQDDKAKKKIEIRGKCFNSDDPKEQITPRLIIATIRPGPGQAPIPARDVKPRIDEKKFFVVEFEQDQFIENLTFEFPGDFNAVILKKLICKEAMTIYFAASDAKKGTFNFPGYTSQLGTYRDIFNELVKLGETPDRLRQLFRDRLLNMPFADDQLRLPGLTPQEREEAGKLRNDVLRLYGLAGPEKPVEPTLISLPQSCCGPIPSATIIVHVPANARLLFDGEPTSSTGETRFFSTPPLQSWRTFSRYFSLPHHFASSKVWS